ncbi:hypothetical protein BN946_scf185014.g5 [Trametes cinnabarina]|uniref:Uncharacterized protein n=1 Tax=Pycnoporus cinnabarinus TaxID=5643 RepID=A0A060SGK6_PYCCI|nr:hypothetical protein BN946_scf185014.g5 [Trametes cinnabarina]
MVDLMEPYAALPAFRYGLCSHIIADGRSAVWFLFPHARLTAILVASFLADLRKAAEGRTYQESLASMGSLEFRVIGSFAASLTSISGAHLEEGEITDQGDSTSEGEGGNREGRAEAEVEVEAEAEAEAVAGPSGWSAV